MVITDRFDHVIDDKQRLAIPSLIRNAMDPQEDGVGFYLVPEERHLQLIPEKLFKRRSSQLAAGLGIDPDVAKARRFAAYHIAYVEPDKAGRIIIPERFMKESKNRDPNLRLALLRDVTLMGNFDYLELWNREELQSHIHGYVDDGGSVRSSIQKTFNPPSPTPAPAPSSNGPA